MFLSDSLWKVILQLKTAVSQKREIKFPVSLIPGGKLPVTTGQYVNPGQPHVLIVKKGSIPEGRERLVFRQQSNLRLDLEENSLSDAQFPAGIWMYLQVCFAGLHALHKGRSVSFAHFAQSLDGRIATPTGKSRWISCRENLLHAHRMRALCDGVLIGANTLMRDQPSLNVRHVAGSDPVKIILGNSAMDFSSLKKTYGKILVISSEMLSGAEGVEFIRVKRSRSIIDTGLILRKIYEKGLSSVFIEGGAFTTSAFLMQGHVDVMQVYLAPKIMGSGIASFSLPLIDEVDESVVFDPYEFIPMGDGVLFCGINMNTS